MQLMRGLRSQIENLLEGTTGPELKSMQIGLAHSLSRYKLKFSPDKVDTMIVQAIGLLDDLDKELNTYAMRLKEVRARRRPIFTLASRRASRALFAPRPHTPTISSHPPFFPPPFFLSRSGTAGTSPSWARSSPTT